MPCSHPQHGFVGRNGQFVTSKKASPTGAPMSVPCSKCQQCRAARAADWATRIMHEAQMHKASCFITLTYDDEHLPGDYSVNNRHVQLFMKRLRQYFARQGFFALIRFVCGAEYGDDDGVNGPGKGRPHYHIILFGVDFLHDRQWWTTRRGNHVYKSATLDRLWGMGMCEIGSLTVKSAGYLARYTFKKMYGALADTHYQRVHPSTGAPVVVEREFMHASNRPGIGAKWFDKFESDVFPGDFVIMDGRKRPVPQYYSRKLKGRFNSRSADANALIPKDDLTAIALKRRAKSAGHSSDRTPERLAVREECSNLRLARLKRSL